MSSLSATRCAWIDGIALWSPTLPGWERARPILRGEAEPAAPLRRPAPELLPAAERRRAPDTVALAIEVAAAAVAAAALDPRELASVYVSAHGDLAISDHMCAELAGAAPMISPTRFHNSVHNAPAGYWSIGSGCMRASTALSAYLASFAAGLLEALVQVTCDGAPLLLFGADIAAVGPLATVNRSRGLLAAALVLGPQRRPQSSIALDWSLGPAAAPPELRTAAARALADNALAAALPLYEALATLGAEPVELRLPLGDSLCLEIRLRPAT